MVNNEDPRDTLLQMKRIMEPRSVAIIGASGKIDKVGGAITRNALESDYQGQIYLVNPAATTIFGRTVYPSVATIPGEIDLAEIVVPAPIVPAIMNEIARKNVKGVIIISAGFAEVGNESLQAQIVRIADRWGIRVIGPNCFGIINTEIGLDLSFTFSKALKGAIAFVSQSGAMCCGTLDWAYKEEIGFSKFINLGNKCDVDEADALLYLMDDPQTKIIAMYLEGVKNGRRLFDVMKLVSRRKPVAVLKAGVTEPGARAALSHTGSIAGSTDVVKAAFKQAGAIVVEDIEDLFDAAQVLSQPLAKGNAIAILSNAGGLGVTTADWCHRLGLTVPRLPAQTVAELQSFLLPIASASNPVDMTGNAGYDCYKRIIDVVARVDAIDLIIPIFVSQGLITSDGPARAVVEEWGRSDKPMVAFWMGGNTILNGVRILRRGGVPVHSSPAKVAKAAAALVAYSAYRQKIAAASPIA
jgi:acetyl coenzyme A synthetase (ADP forming)-like protein